MQFERSFRTNPVRFFASLLPAALLLLPLAGSAQPAPPQEGAQVAQADGPLGIEEIVVTARKREETLQTIPVAITAFDSESLETRQIENVSDLQLSIPNINFRKDNFSGSGSFRIRGIGNAAVAASADASAGIHVNTVPMQGARIFETEFFDVERLEVLRGPQSTLYGRNSSAGIINIITRKPDGELGGYVTAEGSNYTGGRLEGAVTSPFGLLGSWAEGHGVRIAAYARSRDGFMKNLATGNDVDDRELYGGRITFAGDINEDTDYSLMISWFEEDDNRARISNQGCTRDTSMDFPGDTNSFPFTIGCSPSASLGRDAPDYSATLSHQLVRLASLGAVPAATQQFLMAGLPMAQAQQMALQAFGFYNPFNPAGVNAFAGFRRPEGQRQVRAHFDPHYEAQEFLATLEFNHRFADYQISVVGGYRSSESSDTTDYFWAVPTQAFSGPRIVGNLPTDVTCPPSPDGGPQRYYAFPDSDLLPGGSKAGCYDRDVLFDWAQARSQVATGEIRLSSDFDGPFNYTVGASYFSLQNRTRYGVWGSSLEEFWRATSIPNPAPTPMNPFAIEMVSAMQVYPQPSHFLNTVQPYNLRALGFFGEGYLDLTENLQFTLGIRHITDRKTNRGRQNFLNVPPPAWTWQRAKWNEWIGRVGLDWQLNKDVLVYANVATGFKGGGFNPGQAAETGVTLSPTFEPEEIVSYEMGAKTAWLGGRLTANLSAFYYDYQDYQISQIQNRTAFNQNVDAEVLGAELDVVWNVIQNLLVNFSASWLNTEIKDFSSFDPSDPSGGVEGAVNIKSPGAGGGNVVVPPGVNPLDCLRFFYAPNTPGVDAVDGSCSSIPDAVRTNPLANVPTTPITSVIWTTAAGAPGLTDQQRAALLAGANTGLINGYSRVLDGNSLPNAPEITLSLGVQYTYPDLYGVHLTARADAYWQDKMFSRIHNQKRDEIDSWEQVNLSLELRYLRNPMFEDISVTLWAQNLTDDDSITGHYLTDETSANFTNYFLLDPRTYGITIRYAFGGDY